MQPIRADVFYGNSGVLLTQFQCAFVMNFCVFLDCPKKTKYLLVTRNQRLILFFYAFTFLAKLCDFFWCLIASLGVKSGKKKVLINSEQGSKKNFKFYYKNFCHANFGWINLISLIFYDKDCVALIMQDKIQTHQLDNYRSLLFGNHGTVFETLQHRTLPKKHLSNRFCRRNFAVLPFFSHIYVIP